MAEDRNRVRTVRKTLSFSPEEWEAVERRMALTGASSFEAFARGVVLDGRVEVKRQVVAFDSSAMRLELARIGNNVNQIARAVNIDDATTYDQMLATRQLLKKLQALLERAVKSGGVRGNGYREGGANQEHGQ